MRVQVLLVAIQYRLYKEEAGDLFDKWFHMVTTTQELQKRTRNVL